MLKSKHNLVKILPSQSYHNFDSSSLTKTPVMLRSEMLLKDRNKIEERDEDGLYDDSRSIAAGKSSENRKAMGKLQRKLTQFKEVRDTTFNEARSEIRSQKDKAEE